MMCKATPLETLACMINTDTVAVCHVLGSHRIGFVLLGEQCCCYLGDAPFSVHAVDAHGVLCVESLVKSGCMWPYPSTLVLRLIGDHVRKRVWAVGSRGRGALVRGKNPACRW